MIRYKLSSIEDPFYSNDNLLVEDGKPLADSEIASIMEHRDFDRVECFSWSGWFDEGTLEWWGDLKGGELTKYEAY